MKINLKSCLYSLLCVVFLLQACSLSSVSQAEPAQPAPAEPASAEQSSAQSPAAENSEPVEVPPDPTTTPEQPENVSAESAAPAVEVVHISRPGNPIYTQYLPGECNTGFNYEVGFRVRPPCDAWSTNLLERAISADGDNFYHYLDILSAQIGRAGDWYYASFDLFGAGIPTDGVPLAYFFELDLDQNGRGELLLAVENLDLYATDWNVTGLRVWRDQNGDVGGPSAVRPDTISGNGYETLLFDEGLGSDPDLVWVRHDPDRYQRIEFAFKVSLLNGKESFMWWAGAMRGNFDPAAFDLVDSQSESTLYEIDTTCGWVYGHEKGYNVKKCFVAPSPTKADKPGPAPEICVKPPHPNPQDNSWWWNEAECEWQVIN